MKINSLKLTLLVLLLLTIQSFRPLEARQVIDFGAQWKFQKTTLTTPSNPTYNDNSWATVNIPHTWNATDAQDGGNNYARTIGWYRKSFNWNAQWEGKRVYLEVLAASLKSDTYVNGTLVGTHKGGYSAFRYDITAQLKKNEPNVIAIKVDNQKIEDIAPLSGDFSFIGGIYREVFLVVAEETHVDLENNGSNGLFLTTSEVSKTSAKLEIRAKVVNKSATAKTLNLKATLKNPDTFTEIAEVKYPRFNPADMAPGGTVKVEEANNITIAAGGNYEFVKTITLSNPHLWDGLEDPYRYQVDFEVSENTTLIDKISDYVGFRYFSADNTGFYLNGRLYPLRGVNRHQDWKDMGYAISKNEHNIDFGMIYEIGANTVRLAHYPQDPYFHELFDKYGIVIWVEIPFVDRFGSDMALFKETTKTQLREMILQRYNRPSILMWGLQNEVSTGSYDSQMSVLIPELHNYTKQLDPTGRLTVQAQAGTDRSNWTTDLFAKNQYPGWYQSGTFGSYMDGYKNKHLVGGKYYPVGMSEYGAGGNPAQHEIVKLSGTTVPGAPYGHQNPWHPEEYQSLVHELAIKDIQSRPWIWGTYVWNMFDFASDARGEGSQPGINDKGLVTHDRQIKKDAFFVYKANWSNEPTVHIASRRYTQRETNKTPVKVYTNRTSVELFVNGVSKGVKQKNTSNCGILEWTDVELANKGEGNAGENIIIAKSNDNYADTVVWLRNPSSSTNLISSTLIVDNTQKTISLTSTVPVATLSTIVGSESSATYVLKAADGTTSVTSGNVLPGMKLIVTAEDGTTQATYTFIVQHIAMGKTATADAVENTTNIASKAVDGDNTTRWAAPNNASATAPHWLEIDLGKNYILNNIGILWFNSASNERAYKYEVLLKKDKETTYTSIVDRKSNTQTDLVTNQLPNSIGRYVKINIVGSTNTSAYAYPSIYEVQINGWMIASSVYQIDHANKIITLPFSQDNVDVNVFLQNIAFSGNETHRVESAAYYVVDGAELVITDSHGKETAYLLQFDKSSGVKPALDSSYKITNQGCTLKIHLAEEPKAQVKISTLSGKVLVKTKIGNKAEFELPKDAYLIELISKNERHVVKYVMY